MGLDLLFWIPPLFLLVIAVKLVWKMFDPAP